MRWTSLQHRAASTVALRVVVFFVVFSLLWITLTDWILGWLVRDPDLLTRLATYKGVVYVVLMALMLGWMTYSAFIEERQSEVEKSASPEIWAPLAIFVFSALLVGFIGYYAYRLQGVALEHELLGKNATGAQLARMARVGSALGLLFLVLAGWLLVLWWRHDQARVRAIHDQLEQETLSLRQQLDLLSTYTNDIVMILDEEGRILGANDHAVETYGYNREELLATGIWDLRAPESLGEMPGQLQDAFAKGSMKFETQHRRRDGTCFPVEVSVRRFEQGGKQFLQSVIRDITERNEARRKLQESEEHFRSIFEQTDVGMVDCALDGHFIRANGKFCKFLGYSEAELQQITFAEVTHPDHLVEDLKQVGRLRSGGLSGYRTMKQYVRKDGIAVWARTSVSLVSNPEGKPLHFVTVIQDIDAWRHAEEQLQEREVFVQRILDTTPNLIWTFDLIERQIVFCTRKVIDILGYTPEEIRGMDAQVLECLIHPEDVAVLTRHYQRIASARYPSAFEAEYRMRHAGGDWRWLRSRDVLFARNKEGRPWQVLGSVEDITERKEAEEALRVREERFRTLVENTTDTIMRFDREGRHLYVNPSVALITNLNPEAFLWKTHREMGFPEDICILWETAIFAVFESGQPYETEFELGEGDERKIIDWRLFPELGPDGQVATVLSIARDLTEARRSQVNYQILFDQVLKMNAELEERVKERTLRLEELLQAQTLAADEIQDLYERAPCGYHSLDENGMFLRVNQTELEWLGYSREEMIGKMCFLDLCTPESQSVFRETFPVFKRTGQIHDLHFSLIRKDGSTFPALLNATAIKRADGSFSMSRSTMLDITELDLADRELRHRQVLLESAIREMEAFSYSVSHDLRAPLRGIDGFSQALIEDYGDTLNEEARHYLTRIRAGTQRMGLLIDDLLKLSRVTRSEIEKQPTDLSAMVQRLMAEFAQGQPGRRMKTAIQKGLSAKADPRLMQTVFENLLGNAWKFTGKTPGAKIEFGKLDAEGAFYVRDNGAGFSMQFSDKLFMAFQRLHSAQEFEGSGIGLALVQRIIQRHGGRIWGEGEEGHGATFYFTLPD